MYCNRKYTPEPKRKGYPEEVRRQALQMYVDGMNLRRIGRHLGIHHRTVSLWVAAQAENKSIATLGDLRPLAEKTEIPESIWSEFVQVGKEPSRADLPREFLRLSRDVRHFLQGEETSRESSS